MAGIAIVCSPPNMAPFGARVAGVHNSPISIAVPAGRHRPLCLDMATSVAAGGKLSLARDKGVPLPSGWALDEAGRPTTDANQAKILLPFGGPKGSGLAMMFETLTSLMVGNPLLGPALRRRGRRRPPPPEQRGRGHRHRGLHRPRRVSRRGGPADRRAESPARGPRESRRCSFAGRAGRPLDGRADAGGASPCRSAPWRTSAASPGASGSRCPRASEGGAARSPGPLGARRVARYTPPSWSPTPRSRQPSSSAGSTPASPPRSWTCASPGSTSCARSRGRG